MLHAWIWMRFRLFVFAAVLLLPGTRADARTYSWTGNVPPSIQGKWATEEEGCHTEKTTVLIFSDGGYRWRHPGTEWRFARGKFDASQGPDRIYFIIQRLSQWSNTRKDPDYLFTIRYDTLKILRFGSNSVDKYIKCP